MKKEYVKGNNCNNECVNFFSEYVTVYDPHHGGNPGASDYEEKRMLCCADIPDGEQICRIKYNCKKYKKNKNSEVPKDRL